MVGGCLMCDKKQRTTNNFFQILKNTKFLLPFFSSSSQRCDSNTTLKIYGTCFFLFQFSLLCVLYILFICTNKFVCTAQCTVVSTHMYIYGLVDVFFFSNFRLLSAMYLLVYLYLFTWARIAAKCNRFACKSNFFIEISSCNSLDLLNSWLSSTRIWARIRDSSDSWEFELVSLSIHPFAVGAKQHNLKYKNKHTKLKYK